jgi:hypothetical protein
LTPDAGHARLSRCTSWVGMRVCATHGIPAP